MDDISQRILRKIGIPDFFEKIGPLNTADFNSVLLKLFSLRASGSSPGRSYIHSGKIGLPLRETLIRLNCTNWRLTCYQWRQSPASQIKYCLRLRPLEAAAHLDVSARITY